MKRTATHKPATRQVRLLPTELTVADERIKKCKYCPVLITWIRSEKTAKYYPVEWDGMTRSSSGRPIVDKTDFHTCKNLGID